MPTSSPIQTPANYEESGDAALRDQLGLRPIAFNDSQSKGSHPDQRPCPSWCWVGQSDEYDHEIETVRPFVARHVTESMPAVAASLYSGFSDRNLVGTATIETSLQQIGQDASSIRVALRRSHHEPGKGRVEDYESHLLDLAVDDARDLVKVLGHLIHLAETADQA